MRRSPPAQGACRSIQIWPQRRPSRAWTRSSASSETRSSPLDMGMSTMARTRCVSASRKAIAPSAPGSAPAMIIASPPASTEGRPPRISRSSRSRSMSAAAANRSSPPPQTPGRRTARHAGDSAFRCATAMSRNRTGCARSPPAPIRAERFAAAVAVVQHAAEPQPAEFARAEHPPLRALEPAVVVHAVAFHHRRD